MAYTDDLISVTTAMQHSTNKKRDHFLEEVWKDSWRRPYKIIQMIIKWMKKVIFFEVKRL